MDSCDLLIVGGGPAGSACASKAVRGGLDTVILDRSVFPRHKVCGGWITPAVLQELQIDARDYAAGRTLQPLTGFRTGCIDSPGVETRYGKTISYGIRRCEFDDYLLRRSGARLRLGASLTRLERSADGWIVNGEIRARMIVGAGGHFCPVARFLGADARKEIAVIAQEAEFEMKFRERAACAIREDVPELYFCRDMRGYGWCFRKGDYLNIGLGRLDARGLPKHVSDFVEFLKRTKRIGFDLPGPMQGHAYLLLRDIRSRIVDDGVLLAGDAAGVSYSQSGEGIRPAIESGLIAADVLLEADGNYGAANLGRYAMRLRERFGNPRGDLATEVGRRMPVNLLGAISRQLMASRWFSRHVVLDRWFLHVDLRALALVDQAEAKSHASAA
jgi:geranylgeranyl reductase family protein